MGGSGGSYSSSNISILEKIAKDKIKEAIKSVQKRNVFISFSSDDLNEVNLLRGQSANDDSKLEFSDRSLKNPFNSENEEYIKRGIREKISQASVTVVYLTENSANSKWVDWEIRQSIKMGKGVVAMHSGDTPPSNLPTAIKENNISPTRWKHSTLNSAIESAAQDRNKD